jgi:hypothetical protein
MQPLPPFPVALLAALAVLGCKDADKCNVARGATASAWEAVKNDAGRFKLSGAAGYDELSTSQKQEHYQVFSTVESQAKIVFESFATPVIAWNNATSAREKARKEFDRYFQKDAYSGFASKLDAAQKRFTEAEAACR